LLPEPRKVVGNANTYVSGLIKVSDTCASKDLGIIRSPVHEILAISQNPAYILFDGGVVSPVGKCNKGALGGKQEICDFLPKPR
jgi:hypothetical protein